MRLRRMRCLHARLARCKKYVIPVELSGGRLHGVFNTDFRAFLRWIRAARRLPQSFLAGFFTEVLRAVREYF